MMLAEKHIRHYNRLNGKLIKKKRLSAFHAALKKDIDSRRIDAHVQYGTELIAIEKRIRKALASVKGTVKVIIDKPVKIKAKKPGNVIIHHTAQGPEIVKAKGKVLHYHHEDLTILDGLLCDDPACNSPDGLGYTRDGQQKIYDMVTGMMLDTMKKNGLFWQKPWNLGRYKGSNDLAQNFASKTIYKGVNFWTTNFIVPSYGYKSIYFLTFKQVNELKGKVKKGAKAWPIVYYTWYYILSKPAKKSITTDEYNSMSDEQRKSSGALKLPVLQYYNVFNGDDIEGIDFPSKTVESIPDKERIESAERIVMQMPKAPPIAHGGDGAFYRPSSDKIQMPPMETFDKEQEYYSTLFHEMVHSTGHPSRIGREFGAKGTKEYAFEELIAELGASYLCAESGILYFTLDNSAAYLKGWLSELQGIMAKDNKFFLMAAAKAQAASDFILDVSDVRQEKPTKENKSEASRAPVKRTRKENEKAYSLNGIVDASQIRDIDFSLIELDGDYKRDFLKIYSDTQVMVWGSPGSGKTVYTLGFAQYLAEKRDKKVLYIANEELGRSTFTEKIRNFNIGHPNLKFVKSLKALDGTGLTVDDFDVIFFDSVNSMGWTLDDYKKFCDQHPGKVKILIVQATKDGDFRGGKDWEHEVDIAGEIVNRKLILRKNRLDADFAKKAEKLMIDEMISEKKKKKLINDSIKGKAEEQKVNKKS